MPPRPAMRGHDQREDEDSTPARRILIALVLQSFTIVKSRLINLDMVAGEGATTGFTPAFLLLHLRSSLTFRSQDAEMNR